MSINPYMGVGCPADGDRFIGRKRLLQQIEQDLLYQTQVSLVGLGRIGKTSLGRKILSKISTEHIDITVGRVELNKFRKEVNLWEEILDELFQEEAKLPENSEDAYRQFCRYLKKKRKENFRSILLLDEFDSVIDYDNKRVIIDRLRELACERDRYGITFLFISRRSLKRIQDECSGSNLFGICQKYYLRPFDKIETQQLINRSGIPCDNNFVDTLFEYTGGYPLLLEYFMKEFVSLYCSDPQQDKVELIKKTFLSVRHNFIDLFEEIHKFLSFEQDKDKDEVWNGLCSEFITPKTCQVATDTMQVLIDYGLINDRTKSSCLSDTFYSYVQTQRQYLSSNELKRFINFEQTLREIVKSGLASIYGERWVEDAPKNKPYYERLFIKLNELFSKEQALFKRGGASDILEFSYPGTLKDIIITEWDFFGKIFENNKALFKTSMDAICLVRNPLAHSRRAELIPASKLWAALNAINTLNAFLDKTED